MTDRKISGQTIASHQGALGLALGGLALSASAAQAAAPVVTIVNAPITASTTISYNSITQFTFTAPAVDETYFFTTAAVSSAVTTSNKSSDITDANGSALTGHADPTTSQTGYAVTDQGLGTTINGSSAFLPNGADPAKYNFASSTPIYVGLETAPMPVANPSSVAVTNAIGLPVYGYAELAGTSLIGYAWNPTPGQGIMTADLTPAVPEPASLSLLAVGAAGVLATRRRKRAA